MSRYLKREHRPLLSAGFFLGLGMGGFFDGIVFHQLLQAHNMLSAKVYPDTLVNAEINMFWDGVFHTACYALVSVGLVLSWRAITCGRSLPPTPHMVSAMLAGAGIFNAVEGILDHQVLGLHHVVERAQGGAQLAYDLAFIGSGIVLLGGAALLARATPHVS